LDNENPDQSKEKEEIPSSNTALSNPTDEAEELAYFADIQEIKKMANIAELVELMEDAQKDREWLINQLKRKRQKVRPNPGMSKVAILKMCSPDFISHMLGVLKTQELGENYGNPPPLAQDRHWFYTDIVASSDPSLSTNEQARKIIVLNKLIERTDIFKQRDPDSTMILPTGDGMAIGFDDSSEKPLQLALEVHKGLYRYNSSRSEKDRIYVRIGLDTGPVYIIKDLNGNENVWGPGIIMARRVMDLAREMNILASAKFANNIKVLRPEYKSIMHPIGDYQIKHGETILIYNVYGDGFGNKKSPVADKKQRSKAAEEYQEASRKFVFNHIGIKLEVTDPTIMMTHHTLLWNVVNISKEPAERLFYSLDGEVPKTFPDLNVTIKDEDDKELEIMSLNVNKPHHKEFFVKLKRPLKPGERGRIVKLEYDWEEEYRQFVYKIASDCKKLSCVLSVPKNLEIHQKVAKLDLDTGNNTLASVPAVVRYHPNKTEVEWNISNLRKYDTYRFDW